MFTGLNIQVLASGSTGNCYHVSDGSTPLLIECGIPVGEIKKALGYNLSDVSACLVSHSHMDHCKAVKGVTDAGVNVYLSQPTAKTLGLNGHRVRIIDPKEPPIKVGSWMIKAFKTEHDCEGSLGFYMVSRHAKKTLVYISDSFYSRYTFKNVTHWMIEINWDKETLNKRFEAGKVEPVLMNRLLRSHMNLDTAVDLFKANDLSKTEQIYVIHVSKDNANPELIKRRLQEVTGKMITI